MNLKFDSRGNLEPYKVSRLDLNVFKSFFQDKFPVDSSRYKLFTGFELYLEDFKKLIDPVFKCWLDGSFTTNKPNPADIDVIIIIDYRIILQKEQLLHSQFMGKNARNEYGVDGYLIYEYPIEHSKRFITEHDMAYWLDFFGKTRPNRNKKQFSKGLIEIQFEN